MAGTRKRKHVLDDTEIHKQSSQQNIKGFGSIRKAHETDNDSKKRKTAYVKEEKASIPEFEPTKSDKKRKRRSELADETTEGEVRLDTRNQSTEHFSASTPRSKRFKAVQLPSPAETPSKKSIALFDKLKLDSAPTAIPFSLASTQRAYDTPPYTPEQEYKSLDSLPGELHNLIQLHAAFLSALSLYYAHNGTSSPVNVQQLLPMITKTYKKRSVTLNDLRMILAIGLEDESSFILKDFARGGICLVKAQPRGRASKRAASFVDETGLCTRFEEAIYESWCAWIASGAKAGFNVEEYLASLTLAEITQDESVEKAAPLFARGQQRLADIKTSQAASKPGPTTHAPAKVEKEPTQAAQSRSTNLLDRILAKQALTTSLPAGPTKAELERKAALHRIEDITRVLDLLAAGRTRCSFSMQSMVQQLQQSLRSPISREEAERCFELIAREIAPGFVNLVRSGSVTGVVVTRGGRVGSEELRRRVQLAGA